MIHLSSHRMKPINNLIPLGLFKNLFEKHLKTAEKPIKRHLHIFVKTLETLEIDKPARNGVNGVNCIILLNSFVLAAGWFSSQWLYAQEFIQFLFSLAIFLRLCWISWKFNCSSMLWKYYARNYKKAYNNTDQLSKTTFESISKFMQNISIYN